MKFTDALVKFKDDSCVQSLDAARIACQHAGCHDEEWAILQKLVTRLRALAGKPIILGV